MTLQIDTKNRIIINGKDTGLAIAQRRHETVIYTPERHGLGKINQIVDDKVVQVVDVGTKYQEHKMPYTRYSSAHDAPSKPGQSYDPNVTAGRAQLEADVLALLERLGA